MFCSLKHTKYISLTQLTKYKRSWITHGRTTYAICERRIQTDVSWLVVTVAMTDFTAFIKFKHL